MIDRSYRLSLDKRIKGRTRIQKEAIEQIMSIWKTGERSAVLIRPTGFGKTFTVASIVNMRNYRGKFIFKKVLFVYPMNCIKQSLRSDIAKLNTYNKKNNLECISSNTVTFISYQVIAKQYNESQEQFNDKYKEFDLIVFDEFHCAGASKTAIGCNKVFKAASRAKALGMTATYNRTDGVNQALEVFGVRNLTDIYTYTDAVREGLMPKLAYYDWKMYRMFNEQGKTIKASDSIDVVTDLELIRNVTTDTIVDNTIHNFGEMLRESVIDSHGEDELSRGMRWLCYFSDINDILAKVQEVEVSFKTAFPDKEIKILKITSEDTESRENLNLLEQRYDNDGNEIHNEWLYPNNNTCIVLLTCNMLNMGYHAGNLTGEIIYRKTNSEIIYQQQIGRALTIEREDEPIIIDLVGALDYITSGQLYNGYTSSHNNNPDKNNVTYIGADAISGECLECRASNRTYTELAEKFEKFRYHDILTDLITIIVNTQRISTKDILDYARKYRIHPKYIFGELEYIIEQGKCDVVMTTIGTVDGITKINKERSCKELTEKEKIHLRKLFKLLKSSIPI